MSEYVVDTCVLMGANNEDMRKAFPIMKLLLIVLENHRLCLDTKREILKEYEENEIYGEFSGEWLKSMQRVCKIMYVKKSIGKKQRKDLKNLRFDSDDIKFVATANVCGKRIISDDTDYTETITAYLLEKMGIRIFSSNSKLE